MARASSAIDSGLKHLGFIGINVYHVGHMDGGKWELMSYVQWVSSHLPPLGGVGASDMIDIGWVKPSFGVHIS